MNLEKAYRVGAKDAFLVIQRLNKKILNPAVLELVQKKYKDCVKSEIKEMFEERKKRGWVET